MVTIEPLLQPFSGAFHRDPYATYRRLREVDPVHAATLFGTRFWVLTRYVDIVAALRDPRLSSAAVSDGLLPSSLVRGNLLFADPPQHSRLRQPLNRAFLPPTVESLRPQVQALVDESIDLALEHERCHGSFDAVHDLALPVSLGTIVAVMGLSAADRPRLHAWTEALSGLLDIARILPALSAAHRATAEVVAYFQAQFAARRHNPVSEDGKPRDLLCSLLIGQEAGPPPTSATTTAPLSEQERIATSLFTLMAGHETVTSLIGSGLWLLARHPQQWARLRADPALIDTAIDEMLRYEPPAQLTTKTATCDLEIGGQPIAKGELVVAVLAAANRDPAAFSDPECFDIGRRDIRHRHLSFGHGPHFCVGSALARMQGQVLFATLLQRLPQLWIDVAGAVRPPGVVLRGLRQLPARSQPPTRT